MLSSRNSKFPFKNNCLLSTSRKSGYKAGGKESGVWESYHHFVVREVHSDGVKCERNLGGLGLSQERGSHVDFWGKTVAGRGNTPFKCVKTGHVPSVAEMTPLQGGREVGGCQREGRNRGEGSSGPRWTTAETWAFTPSEAGIHWRVLSICFSPLWRIMCCLLFCLNHKKGWQCPVFSVTISHYIDSSLLVEK